MSANVIEGKDEDKKLHYFGKKNFRLLRIILKRRYHCLISHICLVFFLLVMTVNW